MKVFLLAAAVGITSRLALRADEPLVHEGASGLGKGKHIIFLAGDHEYRSEDSRWHPLRSD